MGHGNSLSANLTAQPFKEIIPKPPTRHFDRLAGRTTPLSDIKVNHPALTPGTGSNTASNLAVTLTLSATQVEIAMNRDDIPSQPHKHIKKRHRVSATAEPNNHRAFTADNQRLTRNNASDNRDQILITGTLHIHKNTKFPAKLSTKHCTNQKTSLTLHRISGKPQPFNTSRTSHKSPGGGMVDALVSGASAERRAGSSPVLGTPRNRK